jgi:hypothetical protein
MLMPGVSILRASRGITAYLNVADTLWIRAANSEGVGYQPLPRPAGGAR